eukprot:1408653-Rhodomonas_salina.10
MSEMRPGSMLLLDISVVLAGLSGVSVIRLASVSPMILSRESSDSSPAVPTAITTFATSLRSVLTVSASQKMCRPPLTTGIEAESVVLVISDAAGASSSPPGVGEARM